MSSLISRKRDLDKMRNAGELNVERTEPFERTLSIVDAHDNVVGFISVETALRIAAWLQTIPTRLPY